LQENIERLLEQKQQQELRNKQFQEQIDELQAQMRETEKYIEKTQKNSTLNDIKIEPKIYLKENTIILYMSISVSISLYRVAVC